jgi:hypothetical protein
MRESMPEIEINGGLVNYEFVGPDTGEVVVLTPGNGFSKDFAPRWHGRSLRLLAQGRSYSAELLQEL